MLQTIGMMRCYKPLEWKHKMFKDETPFQRWVLSVTAGNSIALNKLNQAASLNHNPELSQNIHFDSH